MSEPLTKEDVEEVVERKVGGLLAAHQETVDAKVEGLATIVSTQIGASEKITAERIKGLGWKWGAALVGGQAFAGLAAAFVARGGGDPAAPVRAAAGLIASVL